MAIRTYKVTIDSKNTIAPEPVLLRQGDKTGSVVIDATLMDNGVPVSLNGLTPMFKANTADGKAVINDSTGFNIINTNGGEFTYQVPSQLGSVPGKIKIAYFSLVDYYGNQSTFDIAFVVYPGADMTRESAKDWVSNLDEIIDKYNQWVNNAHSSWEDFVNENKQIIESIDPGGTLLTEVINARKPTNKPSYATLGERLNNMPSNEDLETTIGDDGNDVDGGIPGYMQSILSSALATINTAKFNLGFGTDYHYDIASTYNPHNGNYTSNEIASMWRDGLRKSLNIESLSTKLDAVVFGGDNVDSPDQSIDTDGRTTMLKEQRDFANVAFTRSESPIFILKGNHDCNYYNGDTPSTIITDQEIATIYRQKEILFNEIRKDSGNYFYKDFSEKNVRLIGLDSYDMPETPGADGKMQFNRFTTSGFQQEQLDWLANVALGTIPTGYVALIALHHPVNHTLADDDDAGCINHDVVKQILEDFVAGTGRTITSSGSIPATVTYAFKSAGIIAGVLSGHRHLDTSKTVGNINYIETRCSLTTGDNVDGATRMAENGTANEDAFDIATIDILAKTLTMTRVGSGSGNPTIATRKFNFGGAA